MGGWNAGRLLAGRRADRVAARSKTRTAAWRQSSTKSVRRRCGAKRKCDGVFTGAEVDRRDGFIHFSTADQVEETAARHFAGARDLVLVAVDADTLGAALKWEPSRGGALFPHLYGDLALSAVESVVPLPLASDVAAILAEYGR